MSDQGLSGETPCSCVPGSQVDVTSHCCFLPRERANWMGPPTPTLLPKKVLGVVVPTQTSILGYFILSDPSAPTRIMALFFLAPSVIFLSFPVGRGRHSLAWEHRHALPPGSQPASHYLLCSLGRAGICQEWRPQTLPTSEHHTPS